jgi:hypothetical protein
MLQISQVLNLEGCEEATGIIPEETQYPAILFPGILNAAAVLIISKMICIVKQVQLRGFHTHFSQISITLNAENIAKFTHRQGKKF